MECPKCQSQEVTKRGIRNNLALEGKTPSQVATDFEFQNKNGWLELIQRGYYG